MLKVDNLGLKDYIFIILATLGVVFFIYQKIVGEKEEVSIDGTSRVVQIAEKSLLVEIAASEEAIRKGLGGISEIEDRKGMLFVHQFIDTHAYNMSDMKFDLDFIFINQDQVVDIAKSVSHRYNGTIKGAVGYDKVIEVNADWVRKNNIKIGDSFKFSD